MSNLEEFDPTIIKLAKAYQIPNMDWQDIAQELRIHLWQKEKTHTPRNYQGWAYITCHKKIIDLWKYTTRQKRCPREPNISLEVLLENGFEIGEDHKLYYQGEDVDFL
jgi:DNA-directed RNA polymerase specialized sigma24 family protein